MYFSIHERKHSQVPGKSATIEDKDKRYWCVCTEYLFLCLWWWVTIVYICVCVCEHLCVHKHMRACTQWTMYSTATGAESNFRWTFENVTVAQVGLCLYVQMICKLWVVLSVRIHIMTLPVGVAEWCKIPYFSIDNARVIYTKKV